jgi:NDP-sugar pyrophosphorylase family protein
MQAIILAGGLGTRLRPYTFTVPKPLLPLGDKPLLDFIISHLTRFEVTEIILALGYQAELIRAYCGDGRRFGVTIRYVEESRPLGTAGCLSLCRPLLRPDAPCVLMNGDIVTRLDFSRMLAFHQGRGARLTIGYVYHTYQSPFGVLELDGDAITGVVEKPQYRHPVSAGIYALSPEAVALVADDTPLTMPELALQLRARGGAVLGYEIREFWRALETRDHFEELLNDAGTLEALDRVPEPPGPAAAHRR